MTNTNKKAAEILVECGYAPEIGMAQLTHDDCLHMGGGKLEWVEPFADTIQGRRQADAIEDYIRNSTKGKNLWSRSYIAIDWDKLSVKTHHQWRLDRIKWCLEQLTEVES